MAGRRSQGGHAKGWTVTPIRKLGPIMAFALGHSTTLELADSHLTRIFGAGYFIHDGRAHFFANVPEGIEAQVGPKLATAQLDGQYSGVWSVNESAAELFTDSYALKPLFYLQNADGQFFSSDIRAILLLQAFDMAPNMDLIASTLGVMQTSSDTDNGQFTAYEGIRKLRPLEKMIVDRNGCRLVHQNLDLPSQLEHTDFDTAVRALEKNLDSIVHPLLAASPSAAIFDLSGGVDSATVIGSALQSRDAAKVVTSSLAFSSSDVHFANDKELIEKFASSKSLPNHIHYAEESGDLEQGHPPFLGPNTIASYGTILSGQSLGIHANALFHFSGEGADFHYVGVPIFFDHLLRTGRVREAIQQWHQLIDISSRKGLAYLSPLLARWSITSNWIYRLLYWKDPPTGEQKAYSYLLTDKGRAMAARTNASTNPQIAKERGALSDWHQLFHFDMLFPRSSYQDWLGHLPVTIVAP